MRIWLVALIVIVVWIGVADAYSLNNLSAGLSNGAYINIPYNLTYDGSFNVTSTHLQLWLNSSNLTWSAATNKTLTGINYTASADNYTFTASETAGYTNFSATMQNASNSYNLTANGAFIESRNTTSSKDVWFNYTGALPVVLTVTWNGSVSGSPPSSPGLPDITSFSPATPTTLDVNNFATFYAGANQSVNWVWGGTLGVTEGAGDGTPNSSATVTPMNVGAYTVTASCSNANGSCTNGKTWNVNVASDGSGGGTDYDYLTGTVNVAGATITTNPNVGGTTGGAYSYGYVFVHGNTYWINVSKAGYASNNTQITFTSDHTVWNPILTANAIPIESLASVTVSLNPIYKCQPSTITATFNDFANLTAVNLHLSETGMAKFQHGQIVPDEIYAMAHIAGGSWQYIYGNDATLPWGNKSISFDLTDVNGLLSLSSNNYILVYSDNCVGTNMLGWQNATNTVGNYTSKLWTTNMNFFDFMIYPWVEYWGYVFYLIITFIVCIVVYMKTQKIYNPLFVALIMLGSLSTTTWIPHEFKNYITLILGVVVGSLMYRMFKS